MALGEIKKHDCRSDPAVRELREAAKAVLQLSWLNGGLSAFSDEEKRLRKALSAMEKE